MGDVTFRRDSQGGSELLFAYLPTGEAVWGIDLGTRQEWWYVPEKAEDARPSIAAAFANADFDDVGRQSQQVGPGADLAAHAPGHAVLSHIAERHSAAVSQVANGFPGTLDEDIANWCVGYVGEARVGSLLGALGAEWRVLHSVPVGSRGSDIDHVVIGPAGWFTVNTKHHPAGRVDARGDAVFVAGKLQPYIRNARLEAERATNAATGLAPTAPLPVLAVMGARLRVKEPPQGVVVLDADHLVSWLTSLPRTWTAAQVDAVFERVRWSGHWSDVAPPEAAPAWTADFARHLAAERALARQARRRQTPGTATSTHKTQAKRSAGTRTQRHQASTMGILVRIAVLLALVLLLPSIIAAFASSISRAVPGPARPSSAATASPSAPVLAAPGKRCSQEGSKARGPSGRAYTCTAQNGKLVWQAS